MMKKTSRSLIAAIIAGTFASVMFNCSHAPQGWSVEGRVDGADGARIALESFTEGSWRVVDSISTGADGSFSYESTAPAPYPEIMRLTLNGASVYFPIDSVDHLTVNATAADFSGAYTLSGTPQAAAIHALDSIVNTEVKTRGADAVAADSAFKRSLFERAWNESSVMPVYYIVNKAVGGHQLYNIANRFDRRMIRAVAQRFSTELPGDPRADYIARQTGRAAGFQTSITVPETGIFEIVRFDPRGKRHALSETAAGKVTVLSFTSYDLESSAAYNVLLNDEWEKHHDAGLEIYQIAFDPDETMWRMRAANLPWTAVWNANSDGTDVLVQYNVTTLPTTFILGRDGQLAERVDDPSKLGDALAKYF